MSSLGVCIVDRARRPILFWCHLAADLTAAIVVAIMSVTGSR